MVKPFLSICIPTYNRAEIVFKCVQNCLQLPYSWIEVVVTDNCSTDNTKDIMIKFKESNQSFSRVSVLDNSKKILPCGWNVALAESTGDIILRVDAHSSLPEDFISRNVNKQILKIKNTGKVM